MNEIKQFNAEKKFSLDDYNDDDEPSNGTKSTSAIDWRSIMNPVRNQGSCGSCWAFSTSGMVESIWWQKYQTSAGAANEWISTQQLVDCDKSDKGCNGGWFNSAINYLKASPPMRDTDYPYVAKATGTCSYSASKAKNIKITGFKTGTTDATTLALLQNGPVAIAIGVSSSFQSYKSGIFNGKTCLTAPNHGVVLVGYGTDSSSNTSYWIVRNSWGATWGEAGYIRVTSGTGVDCLIPNYGYQVTLS